MSSQCANSQRKTQMTIQNTLSWSRALDTVLSVREQLHGLICCVCMSSVGCGLLEKNRCNKALFSASGDYCVDD